VIPIVIGYPTKEAERAARRGDVILGGCCCWGDGTDATHGCRKCGEVLHEHRGCFFRQTDWENPVSLSRDSADRLRVRLRVAGDSRIRELRVGPRSSIYPCFERIMAERAGERS
jgi:hypothetical protein